MQRRGEAPSRGLGRRERPAARRARPGLRHARRRGRASPPALFFCIFLIFGARRGAAAAAPVAGADT